MTIITLETWEYVHACNVGIARFAANWGKEDAPHYKKELMEDDRTATVASAICELAIAKHKYRNFPDVGKNIEVRRVRKGNTIAVRKHQLGQGLILFAAQPEVPEFINVDIWGWLEYDKAWELGEPAHYAPETTRLINRDLLKTELP